MVKKSFKAVELNRLDKDTAEQIRIWRNNEFVRKQSFTTHIISPEEHKAFIDKIKNDKNRGLFVFYLDNEPFGVFQYEINLSRVLTAGYYLTDEEYTYMGYGVIMCYYIYEISFSILKAHKYSAETLDSNKKLISMYKRDNIIEGIRQEHILLDGTYHDIYLVGILEKNYSRIKSKLKPLVGVIVKEDAIENCVLL